MRVCLFVGELTRSLEAGKSVVNWPGLPIARPFPFSPSTEYLGLSCPGGSPAWGDGEMGYAPSTQSVLETWNTEAVLH